MTRTLTRVGLGTALVAVVATISVVLTLAVSRSDRSRTYSQEEVDRQLADARAVAAEPTPTPSVPPSDAASGSDGVESSVSTEQGTFVGKCVSGYPLLSRWTLNTGYRLLDLSLAKPPYDTKVLRVPWVAVRKGSDDAAWRMAPSFGGTPGGLLFESDKDAASWVMFDCVKGQFNADMTILWKTVRAEPVPTWTK